MHIKIVFKYSLDFIRVKILECMYIAPLQQIRLSNWKYPHETKVTFQTHSVHCLPHTSYFVCYTFIVTEGYHFRNNLK